MSQGDDDLDRLRGRTRELAEEVPSEAFDELARAVAGIGYRPMSGDFAAAARSLAEIRGRVPGVLGLDLGRGVCAYAVAEEAARRVIHWERGGDFELIDASVYMRTVRPSRVVVFDEVAYFPPSAVVPEASEPPPARPRSGPALDAAARGRLARGLPGDARDVGTASIGDPGCHPGPPGSSFHTPCVALFAIRSWASAVSPGRVDFPPSPHAVAEATASAFPLDDEDGRAEGVERRRKA